MDHYDSLIIEAGVVFEFFGNYNMDIAGYMYAVGSTHDSIYFRPYDISNPSRGMWGGISLLHNHPAPLVTMSYFSIAYGGSNYSNQSALSVTQRNNSDGTYISHGDIFGSRGRGVIVRDNYGNSNGCLLYTSDAADE